jgi:hypothetical protein
MVNPHKLVGITLAMVFLTTSSPISTTSTKHRLAPLTTTFAAALPEDTSHDSTVFIRDCYQQGANESAFNIYKRLEKSENRAQGDKIKGELGKIDPEGKMLANYREAAIPTRPSNITDSEMKEITDKMMYDMSLEDFLKRRTVKDPEWLNWESDGCTGSLDHPFRWPFVVSLSPQVSRRFAGCVHVLILVGSMRAFATTLVTGTMHSSFGGARSIRSLISIGN